MEAKIEKMQEMFTEDPEELKNKQTDEQYTRYILSHFSHVWLCVTLWFCSLPGSSDPGDSPGKNTRVGCYTLLQGIFPPQRSNPHLFCLVHWQVGSLPPVPPGKLEGNNSRITETEEGISDLEDRMVKITFSQQNIKKKEWKKMKTA